ncbi:condensation domain-containing protein, partial [Actinosynnema sp. NPDC023658]|uniref:condensation domain-containing protein n=1 Tax=Actinosynnema sp. NPDC023658 TaxID=3155465 RepID=UPI0033DF9A46
PGLDLPRLTDALGEVVARHDMLRAVVEPGGKQRVLDRVPRYEIATTDLRDEPPAARSAALAEIRAELTDQVLPVDQWPPFDIRATLLPEDRVRLHVSADLLFVDVRGLFRLLREWRRHYDDPAFAPAPPPLSFRDYVLAERELATEPVGQRAERYWLSRLDELPAAPELPLATAPEMIGKPGFSRRGAVLPEARWSALTAVAERYGLTPSAVLLAGYCEVLRTWSRRPDFTVALSLFDKSPLHAAVDGVVGNFLTPSLFAVEADAGPTFADRAAAVQRRLNADLEHTAFGGIRVLRELTRRRGDGNRASTPVVFSDMLGLDGDALGCFGGLVHSASQTPQVWLENQVVARDGGVVVTWNWATNTPALFTSVSTRPNRVSASSTTR